MFALWDNQPSRGTGGTAQVVGWFYKGYAPQRFSLYAGALSPLDPPEAGLLLHIDPASGALARKEAERPQCSGTKINDLMRLTDRYNRVLRQNTARIANAPPLLPSGAISATDPAAGRIGLLEKYVGTVYVTADTLAVEYAKRVRRTDSWMYGLALIAFVLFNFLEKSPASVCGYAAVTLLMFAMLVGMGFSAIDAPAIHDLRIMVTHGFRTARKMQL